MLRMTLSTSAARAKSYYSQADYYTEGQELTGHWRGKGAERLGLTGAIDRDDWDLLCDNRWPDTGASLTARRKTTRRVGYDFNFHVPKSVSLLYGLTRDERVLEVFTDSVQETMQEMELEAKTRVRKGGRNEDRTTGNLIWGEFIHFTARPEDDVPDPHLHAHCFVHNATFDSEEQRWKAGQFGDIKRDAPYFEAVFHAQLARRLEELGLQTMRTPAGWELAGIERATLEKFSRRTQRIEQLAADRGITDPEAKAELGAKTRSNKAKELSMAELETVWHERMSKDERSRLDAIAKRIGGKPIKESKQLARDAVGRAMVHSFERQSVLPERTLLAEALTQGVGKASRQTIESITHSQPLIKADRDGRPLVTTREVLKEESAMLSFARNGRGASRPIRQEPHPFKRDWLNADQRKAVSHVLQSRDRVMLIRGAAGTGKTSMMQEATEAIEATGLKVFAFAPSAGASRGVLREAGFANADTVARLLIDPDLHRDIKGSVIWIDEAGQLGTRTMRQIFELAEKTNARVILSGDRRQYGSVERGAALRLLEDEAGLMPAEIKEIQRQSDRYKLAVKDLSEGRIGSGFDRLDKLGWIIETPSEERYQALATAYVDAIKAGKTALVVSPTHREGDRITQEIRERLRKDKLLDTVEHAFTRLVPTNLTLGQRQDAANYAPGDVLVFHQNAKGGYKRGQRIIAGNDPLPLDLSERFTLFHPQAIGLTAGDRIRITRNGSAGNHRLNNGDSFTVKGFTDQGDIQLDNGWTLPKDYGHVAYGFVSTSHASQGKTVDRVFIGQSADSFGASSKEQFYVSVSRGREQALIFTDDKQDLFKAIDRSDERLSGTELVHHLDPAIQRAIRERQAERELDATIIPFNPAHHQQDREPTHYDR